MSTAASFVAVLVVGYLKRTNNDGQIKFNQLLEYYYGVIFSQGNDTVIYCAFSWYRPTSNLKIMFQ